jgi:hypothetical protein
VTSAIAVQSADFFFTGKIRACGITLQIPLTDNDNLVTTLTQVNAIIEGYGLKDVKNPTGIAFSLVQLWYYHYPLKEVRVPRQSTCI